MSFVTTFARPTLTTNFGLQQPPPMTNSDNHLHVTSSGSQQAPPTTNSDKNHLWWSTLTTPINSNDKLQRPSPIPPSCNQLQAPKTTYDYKLQQKSSSKINFNYHLWVTNSNTTFMRPTSSSDNHLRQQTPMKFIFDNQLRQPPPNVIKNSILSKCNIYMQKIVKYILIHISNECQDHLEKYVCSWKIRNK